MTTPEISKRLQEDHLLGTVKINGSISFYLNPVAYWIMDSVKYDPGFKQEDWQNAIFRNHVAVVHSGNITEFLSAITEDEITIPEILNYQKESQKKFPEPTFLMDFDSKNFVSNFYDIEVETYIPSDWTGKFDDPLKFLPEEYSNIWK